MRVVAVASQAAKVKNKNKKAASKKNRKIKKRAVKLVAVKAAMKIPKIPICLL